MAVVSIDQRDKTPIYAQLERGLRAAIATGRLRPGDQLPTVRQLAVELSINANTVARVYAELERSGVIETKRGIGSGRPDFFSLYRKLNRTVPIPRLRMAAAV